MMITNAVPLLVTTSVNWLTVLQAVTSAVAAVGTVTAVAVSLFLAWRNRQQFRMTTRLNVLPTLIKETEIAARRIERNGLFFPRSGPGIYWDPPTELRSLKIELAKLEKMEVEDAKTFNHVAKETAFEKTTVPESARDRIRTRELLISIVRNLVQLREEFEELAEKTRTNR